MIFVIRKVLKDLFKWIRRFKLVDIIIFNFLNKKGDV